MSNPYIETASGIYFPFLNPTEDHIEIKDIAFSLANQCRFNGHVAFYSVAEHSVAVASYLPNHLRLAGLLHDAAEAYLSDIPGPVKQYLPDYREMEKKIQEVINKKFDVDTFLPEIKEADKYMTSNEAYYLLGSKGKDWSSVLFEPSKKTRPINLPPIEAYNLFMHWFTELDQKRNKSSIILAP